MSQFFRNLHFVYFKKKLIFQPVFNSMIIILDSTFIFVSTDVKRVQSARGMVYIRDFSSQNGNVFIKVGLFECLAVPFFVWF